jgi:hypothetical protein
MKHHPFSHLYRHYFGSRRAYSRLRIRRTTYQANHNRTRQLAAIGWYPS